MRKLLTLTLGSLLLLAQTSYADTCPSVDDIKHNRIAGWTAYDSDDNKPLPLARLSALSKDVEQFALAEWKTTDKNLGAIHCYYRDKHGSDLEAYLAKSNIALNKDKMWYEVTGFMHCAAGSDKCSFNNKSIGGAGNALATNTTEDKTPAS